ncbi:MAG: DNA-processing protein DprA [Proteobacteria bacterium]|nr:DNA-processing protein DprA [Pseudomonadota bacterium]
MYNEPISSNERRDRLRLIRTESIGPVTWRELMDHFGSAGDAIDALPDFAGRAGKRNITITSAADADGELARLAELDAWAVTLGEPDYPAALAAIDDAPPVLFVRGNVEALSKTGIAIVGARNASANGRRIAELLAAELAANSGAAIISGLARGIDTAAHAGAIAGDGTTIAVMAGGIDIVYPPENEDLYQNIIETGAIVSEMPPGLNPLARHFPRRNRIVSGLSLAVIVVEAAQRSGSLITARMAGEQGRAVLAVPGSPLDPRSFGANHLIREGAILVRNAEDVFEAVRPMATRAAPHAETPSPRSGTPVLDLDSPGTDSRETVISCLSPEPVAVDEIVRRCQLTAPVVRTILLELELAGRLERHPGNRVAAC